VLEQKTEIEALHKRDAESQKAISVLETRQKDHEGKDSDLSQAPQRILHWNKYPCIITFALAFCLTDQLAKCPSIDDISAELEVLKAEHFTFKNFLKESSEKETKEKKEREEKHTKAMSDLAEKLKTSNQRIKTLVSKSKAYETEAADIDKMIFRKDFISFRLLYCIHPGRYPEN
jgi:hypothetical protein